MTVGSFKYFNYLDLDFKPAAEKFKEYLIRENLINDIKISYRQLNIDTISKEIPELIDMFKPIGLDIISIAIFVCYYKTGSIHIDNTTTPCRINFPVLNCEDTVTNFFKVTSPPTIKKQTNGLLFHQFDAKNCEVVDKMYLTKAAVMRVLEPHQVIVEHENYPRVSCTVAFQQDISYLLEK